MSVKTNKPQLKNFRPTIYALLFFIVLLAISFYYISYRRGLWEKDVRSNLLEVLIGKKSKLEKALSSRIYYTKGIAAFVSIHPEITNDEFYDLAKQLTRNDSVISTMSISRDGIINAIYPLKGHEAALGLNLMEHPKRREIVEKTIKTRKTFVAGPVELVEGGIAFISYTPIFYKNKQGEQKFWGMTDIVINKDGLLNDAELAPNENNFEFALKGTDGNGQQGEAFWGDATVFNRNPVVITINLPDGSWVLAATPHKGWTHFFNQDKTLDYVLLFSSIIISILFWLLLKTQLKVSANEKELKAIFNSMHNLIVEFSDKGEYVNIPPTNKQLLYRQESELIGKTVFEVFDRDMADFFMNAFNRCLKTKKLVELEYPLEIGGVMRWFSARISYKSAHRVILNAYDTTDRKKNEEHMRESEQKMKELNDVKDKFFSIIAHDLRSPVGSFKMLTGIMLNDFGTAEPEKTKRMLSSIHLASSNLYDLLENLLSWSHTQRDSIVINKQEHRLFDLCDEAIDSQMIHSEMKRTQIKNEIAEDCLIYCDQYVTLTVIRNLLSNAIKFTPEKGEITISNTLIENEGTSYQKVSVKDSGVGIPEDRLESIFDFKLNETTTGTNNESGSGLGLMLCNEFIEKQGGYMKIDTIENTGTTVSFSLPLQ
ncbi:sensor histidine kinase [Mangrovibacterium lignilyticum]|uniref:sensor histidine kinase n=1 Tax=Mangrovibacterium lignilyticum TaxID=2668052 RepID=UPI0013D1B0F9|nr:ATP-binding protein [Mangrovibacterium lignilyticum]